MILTADSIVQDTVNYLMMCWHLRIAYSKKMKTVMMNEYLKEDSKDGG